jgi:hypothetical protein
MPRGRKSNLILLRSLVSNGMVFNVVNLHIFAYSPCALTATTEIEIIEENFFRRKFYQEKISRGLFFNKTVSILWFLNSSSKQSNHCLFFIFRNLCSLIWVNLFKCFSTISFTTVFPRFVRSWESQLEGEKSLIFYAVEKTWSNVKLLNDTWHMCRDFIISKFTDMAEKTCFLTKD